MDLYHSLIIGLLVLIAFYPILKDQAIERAEKHRRLHQEQSDAINETRDALQKARSEVAMRQLRAKEQRGLYGEESDSAREDNLKYLPGAMQHVEHLEGILHRELEAAGIPRPTPTAPSPAPHQTQPWSADTHPKKS